MRDIIKGIEIENTYKEYVFKGQEPFHLIDKIHELGFESLKQYFDEKRDYLFSQWVPEVFYIDISEYATVTEDAIQNGKHGIYISNGEGIHAYHGTDTIDYELCESLGVRVVELNYDGGTIIGSANDLSIIIVMPDSIGMESYIVLNKFLEIVNKYVDDASIDGNDLLINGEKVMGSMTRHVGNTFVWAAQVTFNDYSEIIAQVCNKTSMKKPAYVNSNKLTRNVLEYEVIKWLLKQ